MLIALLRVSEPCTHPEVFLKRQVRRDLVLKLGTDGLPYTQGVLHCFYGRHGGLQVNCGMWNNDRPMPFAFIGIIRGWNAV